MTIDKIIEETGLEQTLANIKALANIMVETRKNYREFNTKVAAGNFRCGGTGAGFCGVGVSVLRRPACAAGSTKGHEPPGQYGCTKRK